MNEMNKTISKEELQKNPVFAMSLSSNLVVIMRFCVASHASEIIFSIAAFSVSRICRPV